MPNWGGGARGAASGAATGSMFGPWGTAIGAGAGFLGGLFSGGDKKKKEAEAAGLDANAMTLLQKHSGAMQEQGQALRSQGDEALSPVLNYFKQLIGGDPAAMLQATAPERGKVIDQYDAARNAIARFAPRGGGQGSAIAGSYVQQAQQISDITSKARQGAVEGLATLGPQLQSLGLNADQVASMDLNSLIQAVLTKQGFDIQKRGQTMQMWGEVGTGVGSLLGQYLAGRGGGGANVGGSGVAMT